MSTEKEKQENIDNGPCTTVLTYMGSRIIYIQV